MQSTDPEVSFAQLQGTEDTEIRITDGGYIEIQITDVRMGDLRGVIGI